MKQLRDFQVVAPPNLKVDHGQRINHALFPVYEKIRLWIREHNIQAPFAKVVVSLILGPSTTHGYVSVVQDICRSFELVSASELEGVPGHVWTLDRILHALDSIAERTGWRSVELYENIRSLRSVAFPFVHRFASMSRIADDNTMCHLAIKLRPGRTEMIAQVESSGSIREMILLHKDGPLFIEDDFPFAAVTLANGAYTVLDVEGNILGRARFLE